MTAASVRDGAVGFIGLGVMGSGMARCLLRHGHALVVQARRPEAWAGWHEAGATVASTPRELAGQCGIVLLCVSDADAVAQVLFGPEGIASGLASGAVVIDASTIAPASARDFAQQLAPQGVTYLDAPVSGGQQGAEAGTLACMIGGLAAAVDAVRPVLTAFCQSVTHVGQVGAGQTVKACNQIAVASAMLVVAEAVAFARAHGVDPVVMRQVLLASTARSVVLERHGQRVIEGAFVPGFRAELMRKDLRLALQAAAASGVALQTTPLVEALADALCASGRAGWDWSAVALEVQRLSGLEEKVSAKPK